LFSSIHLFTAIAAATAHRAEQIVSASDGRTRPRRAACAQGSAALDMPGSESISAR
jgi:hypothetical protein